MSGSLVPSDSPLFDSDSPLARINVLAYLDQFRRRLLISVASVFVGFCVALFYVSALSAYLLRPLQQAIEGGSTFIYTDPTEAFLIQLKIAAIAGLVLAMPIILFQVWQLASPALRQKERKFVLPFVAFTTFCFVGGALFSHYVVFPVAWRFLGGFSTDYVQFRPQVGPAFSLWSRLLLAFGAIFQLPAIVFLLARMGLASAGFLARNFKYAIFLSVVVGAVITPTPDILPQLLLAGPMLLLYLLSIGIAWVFRKHKRPVDDSEPSE
jgi:sec-independent protein translocase protein TatC